MLAGPLGGIEGGGLRDRRRYALADADSAGGALYCRVLEPWDSVRTHAARERHLLSKRVTYELLSGPSRGWRARSAACDGYAGREPYRRQCGPAPTCSTNAIHLISLSRCGVACTRGSVSATY